MPFILRRIQEYYVLVGECYVHGEMDSEVGQDVAAGRLYEETLEIR
jgi:hypothetical protein